MKTLRILTAVILIVLFGLYNAPNTNAQTIIIGPNQYAFQYSANTNFGLYFNATNSRYEFKNGSGQRVWSTHATTGDTWIRGNIEPQGALQVGANKYAFQYSVNTNYGLFFNATDTRYEFRTSSGAPVWYVHANTGDVVANGEILASGSLTGNGDCSSGSAGVTGLNCLDASGYLGVQGSSDFAGEDSLDIPGDEIGVLGISAGTTTFDNYGVLGFSNGVGVGAWHETSGNRVDLATSTNAIDATGDVHVMGNITAEQGNANYTIHGIYTSIYSGDAAVFGEVTDSSHGDAFGVYGKADLNPWFGYGGYFSGGYRGVYGLATTNGPGSRYGIYGSASSTTSSSYGVYGITNGSGVNYSVFGSGAVSGSTNYAGYFVGDVTVTGTFSNPSDARLKTGEAPIEDALSIVSRLQGKQYRFKEEYRFMHLPEGEQFGLIAQEVEQVLPQLVKEEVHPASDPKDEHQEEHPEVKYKSVNYLGLIPIMVEAIKEQKAIIDQKDAEITQLKEEVSRLSENDAALIDMVSELQAENKALREKVSEIDALKAMLAGIEQSLGQCCRSQGEKQSGSASTITDKPKLEQNIPNPFTHETLIGYYVPSSSRNAQIDIYSLQGVQMKHIELANKGQGYIRISNRELPAGIYIYTLTVDGIKVDSRKMEMMK